jgi:hypothetical protein
MSGSFSEMIQRLEEKAQEESIPANSWDGYAVILRFVEGVLQRLPTTVDLETCNIDARFTAELGYLARLVVDLFPTDSFEELATFFVPEAQEKEGNLCKRD